MGGESRETDPSKLDAEEEISIEREIDDHS